MIALEKQTLPAFQCAMDLWSHLYQRLRLEEVGVDTGTLCCGPKFILLEFLFPLYQACTNPNRRCMALNLMLRVMAHAASG